MRQVRHSYPTYGDPKPKDTFPKNTYEFVLVGDRTADEIFAEWESDLLCDPSDPSKEHQLVHYRDSKPDAWSNQGPPPPEVPHHKNFPYVWAMAAQLSHDDLFDTMMRTYWTPNLLLKSWVWFSLDLIFSEDLSEDQTIKILQSSCIKPALAKKWTPLDLNPYWENFLQNRKIVP